MTASIDGLNRKEKMAVEVILIRLSDETIQTKALLCAIAILAFTDQSSVCPIPEAGDPAYPFYQKICQDLGDFTPKAWEFLARKLSLDVLSSGKPQVRLTHILETPERNPIGWDSVD